MTLLGAVAGVAPDLDFLCELKGKLAGWRYHRVALHGIPMLPLMAAPLVLGALASDAAQAGLLRIVLTVVAALASHLLLDVVTSFGTALLYPFTRRRFSTRSHFIADPIVLVMLALGLVAQRPVTALAAVAAYMASSSVVRVWLTRRVRAELLRIGKLDPRPVLEPRLLSPWRWLVILDDGDSYLVGQVTPLSLGRWQRTQSGRGGPAAPLARQNELLCAFLDTCDFPRFELREGRTLVVEDVKWWLELPFRPLAFTAQLGADGVPGTPRQSAMSDRGPAGITERPPLEPVAG
jgi:inner membrane protein